MPPSLGRPGTLRGLRVVILAGALVILLDLTAVLTCCSSIAPRPNEGLVLRPVGATVLRIVGPVVGAAFALPVPEPAVDVEPLAPDSPVAEPAIPALSCTDSGFFFMPRSISKSGPSRRLLLLTSSLCWLPTRASCFISSTSASYSA